jgi:hypothetical protein
MWTLSLYLWTGCSGPTEAPLPKGAPPVTAGSGTGSGSAAVAPKPEPATPTDVTGEGWGGIVWNGGTAYRLGGEGTIAVGPEEVAPFKLAPELPPRCGAPATSGAPHAAAIVLPPAITTPPPPPPEPPPVAAATIEKVGWRLDEVLPPADRFTPNTPSTDVSQQRGVQVGTVVKMRREGGPPWLVASGTRNCDGGFVVLDSTASRTLVAERIATCDTLRVLNPSDLDGDGNSELAVFDNDSVYVYRIRPEHGQPHVERLGHWSCRP